MAWVMRSSVTAILAVVILVWPGQQEISAADQGSLLGSPHAADHVLVEISPAGHVETILGENAVPVFGSWYRMPVDEIGSITGAIGEMSGWPGVVSVEPDYLVHVDPLSETFRAEGVSSSLVVDDPFMSFQWHLPAVQTTSAWDTSTGEGVLVAVIDSGVTQGGEDLDCHTFVHPYNAITGMPGAVAAEDDHGHGTHVAGTIAQCTDNGIGVAGVAFDARLMPVKVLGQDGNGEFSSVASGIEWARTHGADVINMSLGCLGCVSSAVSDAIDAAVADDIVVVVASGNDSAGFVGFPANHPDVIAVGATDYNNTVTWYSNQGAALDVVAPGGDTSQDANGDSEPDGVLQETFAPGPAFGYYWFQGTSMATPHVAGAAALLRCVAPGIDASTIKSTLESTALDLGAPGFDTTYGHGLIQIDDAIASLAVVDTTPPTWPGGASLDVTDVTGTTVTLSWPEADDDACMARYRIYEGGSQVAGAPFTSTSKTVGGLEPLTEYTLELRAEDVAGNLGPALAVSFMTLDNTPPEWDGQAKIGVTQFGETELRLAWDEASDNIGVVDYLVDLGGGPVVTTETQALVTDLIPGSKYVAAVRARDEAGNLSQPLSAVVRTARHFIDTPGTTFYNDILWMSGMDITKGCNPPANDLFCPGGSVTRGQLAAFFVRALGLSANSHPGFDDVPASSTFAADIGKLATAGITKGCNPPANDLFCPDKPVTRGQLAAFFKRALGIN